MHLRFISLSPCQTDIVEVYLDSGHVRIPDTVVVPKLPFEVADQVSHALATILNAKVCTITNYNIFTTLHSSCIGQIFIQNFYSRFYVLC